MKSTGEEGAPRWCVAAAIVGGVLVVWSVTTLTVLLAIVFLVYLWI